jgi:glycerol-3-phosphate cytidylyltransferase-like family protein
MPPSLTRRRQSRTGSKAVTEAANQKSRQAEFVTNEEQRLLEIEDMRLVVKFGEKKRYSDQEYEAIRHELVAAGLDDIARRDPDAIEAVFKRLNEADEAARARSLIMG